MMASIRLRAGLRMAALLACAPLCAAAAPEGAATAAGAAPQSLSVTATRNPVDKSYRKMLRGMDLFERMHGVAPIASLRFRLLPRQQGTAMEGLEADLTFALTRMQKAFDEDASVRPNRKAGSLTWRADIRTPGLPPDTRRLGDLRLECEVGMEADLVSNGLPGFGQLANLLLRSTGYCRGSDVRYLFFADRALFGVTLAAGDRREVLPVDRLYAGASAGAISKADLAYCDCQVLLDRAYYLPLGDPRWPDDTVVEFEYMEGGPSR
jgi:hypothetical protein